jgi:HPt (histidine-containing phosphotransfer) domain-containing protein
MNPDPVEPSALARIRDIGGLALVAKFVQLFDTYVGPKVAEACAAVQKGDLTAVAEAAHPIKSSAGHMGAHRLQGHALQLEELARGGQPAQLPALADALGAAFQEARSAIQAQGQALGLPPSDPRPA